MKILSRKNSLELDPEIFVPKYTVSNPQILHVGIGGFHRSHQAYAISKLLELDPITYADWRIIGVGFMPKDKILVEAFKKQESIYALRMVASNNKEEVRLIDAINEMLHVDNDTDAIISRMSDRNTKIISFTITEGGYFYDFENQEFNLLNIDIQHDLVNKDFPKTVFGYLAKGLTKRREQNSPGLILLSCDNILGNGHILKLALLSFLESYDNRLKSWVEENVSFPNSMIDRITPVPNEADKTEFFAKYGVYDNCLVVSEDYFQWIIEKELGDTNFPPLEKVGVEFVSDVSQYEIMKLSILNAGHTLVGLLGYVLDYETIHESVQDSRISAIFDSFILDEVIPVLSPIVNLSYKQYYSTVKSRFANAMINDSTARIISGTSDKFPKFVIPTIIKQLNLDKPNVRYAALITACWWSYLNNEKKRNNMANVIDQQQSIFQSIFEDESMSIDLFLGYRPIFGDLKDNALFYSYYKEMVAVLIAGKFEEYLDKLVQVD